MFSCSIRFILLLIVCVAVSHAYPRLMEGRKLLTAHDTMPHHVQAGETYDYFNLADANDNDLIASGFPTWLLRSRKFCCAPPL
ncbi:unnamed protein product [Rotaria socialis]|uniref:Uncharacterized protein n=1 Tax=Rotaria socialis TaxID=392032 RepID=A0A818VG10_9BILA|nr:unnamed protein product [Rotaria socialis]CAF3475062.1 unnamed protein product [Rotaria socialis]CAF3712282.1 unnamed protein product [Rotaria socialis]CAF4152076.1 unnamed protein product [Rotaria socialis]CAF4492512.1 unnamed protein product [Rotaria socialis]